MTIRVNLELTMSSTLRSIVAIGKPLNFLLPCLPVEVLNGHEMIFDQSLHENSELVPLLPEFYEDETQISHTKRQEEVPSKETSPHTVQTYIHPKSGEYNLFPSRIGLASSSNDVHHLF